MRALLLAAACAMALAACGANPVNDPVVKQAYRSQIQHLHAVLVEATADAQTDLRHDEVRKLPALRKQVADVATKLGELEPPSSARSGHAELRTAVTTLQRALPDDVTAAAARRAIKRARISFADAVDDIDAAL